MLWKSDPWVPTQERKCETSFDKNCRIRYRPMMFEEDVEICNEPLKKVCNNETVGQGETVCSTHYETVCETRWVININQGSLVPAAGTKSMRSSRMSPSVRWSLKRNAKQSQVSLSPSYLLSMKTKECRIS